MFITIEGGEGAGKSTLIDGLARELHARRLPVVVTREPGGSSLGKTIRDFLLHRPAEAPLSDRAELLLFLADRVQHIEEVITPALERGKLLLCDRFNDSTIAYQGGGRGLGMDEVQELCELVCRGLKPALTLYLDLDPCIGLKRILQKKHANQDNPFDRIESEQLQFHERVRQAFHTLARQDSNRFRILDASEPIFVVLQDALKEILPLLSSKKR